MQRDFDAHFCISQDCLWEEDVETKKIYIYNPKEKMVFFLEDVGYLVWVSVASTMATKDIVSNIAQNYSLTDTDGVGKDVVELLCQLEENNFIARASSANKTSLQHKTYSCGH